MLRIGAIFIAVCMVLIAASLGAVLYLGLKLDIRSSAIVALAENDDSLPSTAAPFGSPASAGVRVMTRDSAVAGEVTPGEPARSPPKVACALGGSLASFPSGRSDTPRVLAPL